MSITELDALRAGLEMTDGAKAANVAYWMKGQSAHSFDFHTRDAIDHLTKAAAHLGFTLTPITEALPTETPAIRDPDSGRPSLVEPAAPSELSHNYGG